jgi:membrane protein implicated in regulation of membrane protease activity
MIEHLVTRFEAARLDRHRQELLQREEAAIARLGEKTLADGGSRSGRLASLAAEAAGLRGRMQSIQTAQSGSPTAESRQRIELLQQKLRQLHLTAGRLALALPPTGAEAEVLAIRAEMAEAASERDRLRGEGDQIAKDTWTRVQAWVAPRKPALIATVLGWWIARSYAVSHTKAILSWCGYSATRRGAHLVSLTADTFIVQYGLPLVVAAVSAYLAHRLAQRVQTAVDAVRERSSQARAAAAARPEPTKEVREVRSARAKPSGTKSR